MNKKERLVVVISILASFVSFLDLSIINVALPAISGDLGGGLTSQQWVVDAYFLTLGSLILIAGSLSDIFGRKKILAWGLIGFGVTSILCAIAPSTLFLTIARALQGVAGALLVPSSLALIISVFKGAAQGRAIGLWTAWTGIAFIVGPLLGGLLVDSGSWRLIFAINILPIAITLWLLKDLTLKEPKPESSKVDFIGAALCTIGLGGPVYALIEQPHYGWSSPSIYLPLIIGLAAFTAFLLYEKRVAQPMLPLELFKVRNFALGNLATVAIYGALAVSGFVVTVFVQQFGGYSALEAGLALMPVTLILFLLSSRVGALAGKHGPRLFMTLGPIIAGLGFLYMLRTDDTVNYWTQLFPGVLLFGLGLAITVAPLTSAILGSIESRHAGIGSAINNAVARVAGLVAVAGVGVIIGAQLTLEGFKRGILLTAVLLIAGGIISWFGIRNQEVKAEV